MNARIEQIEARAKAATEGPWEAAAYLYDTDEGRIRVTSLNDGYDYNTAESVLPDDAEFIAHAREDVPYLLALVREQAVQLDGLRTDMQNAMADAWDEGFFDGKRYSNEGDDGPRFINPYRAALPATGAAS